MKNLKIAESSFSGDMGWSFRNCISLEHVHLSNGIKEIPNYAFSKCSSLKNLYIPDTVLKIGAYAFNGCSSLVSIHLPINLKTIDEGTFNGCRSLKKYIYQIPLRPSGIMHLPDASVCESHGFPRTLNLFLKPHLMRSSRHN